MRISLESPALIAVRHWLARSQPTRRSARKGSRMATRLTFRAEQLEPRMMLDAGMMAALPDLVEASDTGASGVDNVTSDRTPTLTGSVRGAASQVRLRIDGAPVAVVPVIDGAWTYTVPAEKALAAGMHTIRVRPLDASGKPGALSKSLDVRIVTKSPAASTIRLARASDTGVKGDGQTSAAEPTVRGVTLRNNWVNVAIDGVLAGRVKSDATTGAWAFTFPRLANGPHDITATAENRAGLQSAATSVNVTVNGQRTVMLDASSGQTVELTAAHLLGQGAQGFVVTKIHGGTLQKWVPAQQAWKTIPAGAANAANVLNHATSPIRTISFSDVVRWTPAINAPGIGAAFDIVPLDKAGGATAPIPQVGTVPGNVVNAVIGGYEESLGTTISWKDPTDGCGCPSTRYSIEVTHEDGKTLLYNVPSAVHGVSSVEGGAVSRSRIWGATKAGAGKAQAYDAIATVEARDRLSYTLTSGGSFVALNTKARAQLANSPTGSQFMPSLPLGGSHSDLAYLQVDAVPDATEAAQGLPAGTPMIISSDSSKLTPGQLADLKANPIYASYVFPGTVNGEVQPDQLRAHFQAGETLRFAGTVDASVRAGATIVVESAQNLGDGSLGPWLEEARIAIGADGGFSHDYVVPYGLNSVRTRLEYRTQAAATTVRAASEPIVGVSSSTSAPISTAIDLSGSFNAFGITTAPWQVPNNQGFDRNGNYYNSDYTGSGTKDPIAGTPIQYKGIEFPIGPIPTENSQVGGSKNDANHNPPNFVRATGQTISVSVDADKSDYLYLAGAASNGNQMSQAITLKFTDGSTETWTQSFHDWASFGAPQQDAQTQSVQAKLPVKVVATSAVAGGPTGPQTIDGVALVVGDRVLLQNQSDPTANGIYVVQNGLWSRSKDADTGTELLDASTSVVAGTYAGQTFVNTNTTTIDLGATAVTFAEGKAPTPAPRPFAGELLLKTEPERINQLGDLVTTPAHVFAYCRNLHGKQLESITLPNNDNIGILSAVVAKAPVIALEEGFASVVLGTTNLTGIDLMALTISNESNIGAGGGPLTFSFADQPVQGTSSSVALGGIATAGGIVRDGQAFTGSGFDGDGNAYSWEALGSSKILPGTSVAFKLGLPGQPNFVVANGQTIQVTQSSYATTLSLAGAAVNGGQENQQITLTFTDNSTEVWTQSFSDWCNPENYTNESSIATASYRDTASGVTNQTTNHVYQYNYTIPSGKTLQSITLPTNSNVRLLDIQVTPHEYTTKQVTVPMGQQKTIAYVAPDIFSQMNFSVQKADGTCVGNCSTYLPDWTSGSGSSTDWAKNVIPSLNSQMKAGQHWTMTIQNAGEGYYGYLDSPGSGLPLGSGNTPPGAQFRLMTQTEINAQPPWAVALETFVGTTALLVGLLVTTGGEGDAVVLGLDLAGQAGSDALEAAPELDESFDLNTIEETTVDDAERFTDPELNQAEQDMQRQVSNLITGEDNGNFGARLRNSIPIPYNPDF